VKIGRNDPCPCGSGIKYKQCHLDRESQTELSEGELIGMASSHKIDKKCFHPLAGKYTCNGKIIRSHTISKSSSLKKVSRNGKVLHFNPSMNSLLANNGRLSIVEVGINQASTFPGFCKKHDKELFSPIEDRAFQCDEYSSFLLGYRALTREIFEKESAIAFVPQMRSVDRGKSPEQQYFVQDMLDAYLKGSELGIRDLKANKEAYDIAFKENDYSSSKYYMISFSNIPNLLYSGAVYPEYDFRGNALQVLGHGEQLDHISVNAVSTPAGGCVVFQWMRDSDVNLDFVRSLHGLDEKRKASAITQFAFESFENLYIEPTWWESLGNRQNSLENRVMCGSSSRNHESKCFVPDGTNYHNWDDIQIDTNIEI
jgi:hypothetical protein